MKKIISFVLAAAMSLSTLPALADWNNDEDIMSLLSELNIMVGDDDGNLRLDDNVSRAEFAKIAVASSSYKDTVATGLKVSPFKDVTYTHWSAPYIKAAVSAGIAEGYVDSTFRPDNTVSYEEALTMVLKVLGYTTQDFGDSWPYGQMGLANSLEITKNVNAEQGEALTRSQVARLIYNTLDTKIKDNQSKLITSVFDSKVIEGVTIIASHNEDSSLGTDKIYTTAGTFEFDGNFNSDYVGRKGDIVVKNDEDFVSFTPRDQQVEEYTVSNVIGSDIILDGDMYNINSNTTTYYKSQALTYENAAMQAEKGDTFKLFKNSNGSVDYAMLIEKDSETGTDSFDKYVIYSLLSDAVICYKNGSFEQIDITDGTTCYKDKNKSTYGAVKNEMAMGDILYVKMDGSNVDYVSYEKGNMEGPVKVTNSNWIANFDTNGSTTVMRSGNKVDASEIQLNDIIYYCKDLNMVLAYTDKVTGVYEKASPTKDSPTSVTISGKEYSVESVDAFNALSSSGTFKYGDTVTLLLGRNGEVAGVVGGSESTSSHTTVGFVTETGKKDFTKPDNTVYSSYYAKVVTPDGTVNEYATSSDCSSLKCAVVNVSFTNGKASLSRAKGYDNVSGKFNSEKNKFGDYTLADDVKILDTAGTASDDLAMYTRIYPQRLDGVTIKSSSVLYYSKNKAGEIDELILKDITGDAYKYGVITAADSTTHTYTIDIDGTQNTYATAFSTNVKGPHRFSMDQTGIESMRQLSSYPSNITSLTRTEAKINNQTYLLSDKVIVYHKTDVNKYLKITLDDAINGNYKLTAYYDKAQTLGGRIRIIIAQ